MRLTSPMMAAPVPNLEISAKKASLSTMVRFHRSPCVRGNSGEEGCGQGEIQKKKASASHSSANAGHGKEFGIFSMQNKVTKLTPPIVQLLRAMLKLPSSPKVLGKYLY